MFTVVVSEEADEFLCRQQLQGNRSMGLKAKHQLFREDQLSQGPPKKTRCQLSHDLNSLHQKSRKEKNPQFGIKYQEGYTECWEVVDTLYYIYFKSYEVIHEHNYLLMTPDL